MGEGERNRRCDPGDFHDWEEAGAPGGVDLMEGAGAGDDSHHAEVDGVLDRCNLRNFVSGFMLLEE